MINLFNNKLILSIISFLLISVTAILFPEIRKTAIDFVFLLLLLIIFNKGTQKRFIIGIILLDALFLIFSIISLIIK